MEERKLKRFTFYDLYWKLIKDKSDTVCGRFIKNVCKIMFDGELPEIPSDDTEAFIWSNIEDILNRTKEIELSGRVPKTYNKRMAHFTFEETYGKAIKLMGEDDCGAYLKALCGFMFENREPKKLKPPVDGFYELAKIKMELSKIRIVNGHNGGIKEKKNESLQPTAVRQEGPKCENLELCFEEFMRRNPHLNNDLFNYNIHLKDGIDWAEFEYALRNSPQYRNCTSLATVLTHRKDIMRFSWC